MTNPISDWTVIALAVVVLINTAFIAGLAVALFMINQKVHEALDKAGPVLLKATETLSRVETTTAQLHSRVDQVLEKTSDLVDRVSERVDTTTAIAEEAITEPLIGAASIVAGINRGLRTYSERSTSKGDGLNGGH
jgi:Na+-transporting NADH:ubiquinone oxidoreductase subunit NqrC